MKLLILTAFYPIPGGTHERMFVHVRNRYYQENGAKVTVLNFASQTDYTIDGIKVISLGTYENSNEEYDIAVSHSANVRNHYCFLKKYEVRFKHLVFFFHGHEVLYLTKDYPKPFSYTPESKLTKLIIQRSYDEFKIRLWKKYYKELAFKSEFIYVSNWIFNRFQMNTGITPEELYNHCHVINNSIGEAFEKMSYSITTPKKYDYITIRSNMDGSKYCVDLVVQLAKENPKARFLLIGKGQFFSYNQKPDNVEWINGTLNHDEMLNYLNSSKCSILLTREDTQGVMTCEIAAFGMPVITSDIDVCREIFNKISNVAMISNDGKNIPLEDIYGGLAKGLPYQKCDRYFAKQTIQKEMNLFYKVINEKKRKENE